MQQAALRPSMLGLRSHRITVPLQVKGGRRQKWASEIGALGTRAHTGGRRN